MDDKIKRQVDNFTEELVGIRRDIHQHPETGFEEHRTSRIVADYLKKNGINVHQGLAKTGVVGTLEGKLPGDRVIGLRADMDALSIQEKNELPYCSKNSGIMHACGHDGHTAMLLGAARYLSENRHFSGTVHFIFQPAEESFGGGRVMVEEGLFKLFPCDAVYGLHAMTGYPMGQFLTRDGSFMASGDTWTVTFTGSGGHGATPHRATDPVMPGMQFLTALQTIISRTVPPEDTAIISTGYLNGGQFNAPNIIPSDLTIKGTARCYSPEIRDLMERRIGEIARSCAATFNCEADIDYLRRYPPLKNRTDQVKTASRAAEKVVGAAKVVSNAPRIGGSEDFSFMLEQVPGAYMIIGTGNGPSVHTPYYNFNDDAIPLGVAYWINLVHEELSRD